MVPSMMAAGWQSEEASVHRGKHGRKERRRSLEQPTSDVAKGDSSQDSAGNDLNRPPYPSHHYHNNEPSSQMPAQSMNAPQRYSFASKLDPSQLSLQNTNMFNSLTSLQGLPGGLGGLNMGNLFSLASSNPNNNLLNTNPSVNMGGLNPMSSMNLNLQLLHQHLQQPLQGLAATFQQPNGGIYPPQDHGFMPVRHKRMFEEYDQTYNSSNMGFGFGSKQQRMY